MSEEFACQVIISSHVLLTTLGLPNWFTYHLSETIEERDGQLYIHFMNNRRIYAIGNQLLLSLNLADLVSMKTECIALQFF